MERGPVETPTFEVPEPTSPPPERVHEVAREDVQLIREDPKL
jgi:hypothetical protein